MARKYFKGRDPIGQRFGYDKPDIEIVGVVRDARVNTVREAAVPMVFYPLRCDAVVSSARCTSAPPAIPTSIGAGGAQARCGRSSRSLPVDRITTIADAGREHVAAGTPDRAADDGGRRCSRWRSPAWVSTD